MGSLTSGTVRRSMRWPIAILAIALASLAGCTEETSPDASRTEETSPDASRTEESPEPSRETGRPSAATSRRFNLDEVSAQERATFDLCAHVDRYARANAVLQADSSGAASHAGPGPYETPSAAQAARWHMASVAELADDAAADFPDLVATVLKKSDTGSISAFDAAFDRIQVRCDEVFAG